VLTTIPDLHLTIDDMIAERDKVVVRLTVDGTMKGEYKGLAPTGKHATWKGVDIYTIVEGKIVERWVIRDHLSMMRQWGILSLP
jgi:predicted ester cyclase